MALSPEQCREQFEKQDKHDQQKEAEIAAIIKRCFEQLDRAQRMRVIVYIANTHPRETIEALEASVLRLS